MRVLWRNFVRVAEVVHQHGGFIANEWPTECEYWTYQEVIDFCDKYQLQFAKCHGCAFGLKSVSSQVPIKKPWTIATNDGVLFRAIREFVCPGPAVHPIHAPCAGADTKISEGYTPL